MSSRCLCDVGEPVDDRRQLVVVRSGERREARHRHRAAERNLCVRVHVHMRARVCVCACLFAITERARSRVQTAPRACASMLVRIPRSLALALTRHMSAPAESYYGGLVLRHVGVARRHAAVDGAQPRWKANGSKQTKLPGHKTTNLLGHVLRVPAAEDRLRHFARARGLVVRGPSHPLLLDLPSNTQARRRIYTPRVRTHADTQAYEHAPV